VNNFYLKIIFAIFETNYKMSTDKRKECAESLNIVFNNMDQAQILKGTFTLQECRSFLESKETLSEFLNLPEGEYAKQNIFDAFGIFTACCHKQASAGVFHIKGSVMILEALEMIEKEINDSKDPELKLLELKNKFEKSRKSKK
jgi:hypothetical protein